MRILIYFLSVNFSEIFSAAASTVEQLGDPSHDATEAISHVSLMRCGKRFSGVHKGHDLSQHCKLGGKV